MVDRLQEAKRRYPHFENLDWERVFTQDPSIMGAIIHDILKADAAQGTTGRRPHLKVDAQTGVRLRQLLGEDHATIPFHEVFQLLVGEMALSTVAHKTGLSKTEVWRLLRGPEEQGGKPTMAQMEAVTHGFRRHPSFFAEWRAGWLIGILERRISKLPEATVGFYQRLSGSSQ